MDLRSIERKFAWAQTPQLTVQSPSETLVRARGVQTRNRVDHGVRSAAKGLKIIFGDCEDAKGFEDNVIEWQCDGLEIRSWRTKSIARGVAWHMSTRCRRMDDRAKYKLAISERRCQHHPHAA